MQKMCTSLPTVMKIMYLEHLVHVLRPEQPQYFDRNIVPLYPTFMNVSKRPSCNGIAIPLETFENNALRIELGLP